MTNIQKKYRLKQRLNKIQVQADKISARAGRPVPFDTSEIFTLGRRFSEFGQAFTELYYEVKNTGGGEKMLNDIHWMVQLCQVHNEKLLSLGVKNIVGFPEHSYTKFECELGELAPMDLVHEELENILMGVGDPK